MIISINFPTCPLCGSHNIIEFPYKGNMCNDCGYIEKKEENYAVYKKENKFFKKSMLKIR